MDIEQTIVRRILAANKPNHVAVSLIYHHVDARGAGEIMYEVNAHGRSKIEQLHIPKTMGPSLLGKKRNASLDALLRL